jgi:hypothetical protein
MFCGSACRPLALVLVRRQDTSATTEANLSVSVVLSVSNDWTSGQRLRLLTYQLLPKHHQTAQAQHQKQKC